jgi:hypothetical protein
VDQENRTVEAQFYSGAEIPRFSWDRGRFLLTFRTDKKSVRLEKLNAGRAPVLDAHDDWSMKTQIGIVKSAELRGDGAFAMLRYFFNDTAADTIWNKIEQGARNVSMGAYVHKMRELESDQGKGEVKRFEAVDWEPIEISNVAIGADGGAHIQMKLSENDPEMIEVEVQRATARSHMEVQMPEKGKIAGEPRKPEAGLVMEEQLASAQKKAAADAVKAWRAREESIRIMVKPFQLSADFVAELINSERTVEQWSVAVLEHMARQDEIDQTSPVNPSVTVTRDERETRITLASSALLHQIDPKKHELEQGNEFRGRGVSRIAEDLLVKQGISVAAKSPVEIATLAMQNTADFPYVLENVARKRLQDAYQYVEPSYKRWTKPSTHPDFKTMSRPRLGETPAFLTVPEGAQITIGSMTESREQYAIATYGRGVSFTRQMLINDDLGAFNDIVGGFGVQAARLENQTVYAILTANAAMADSTELFHADHGNLGTGVIANTALDAMFTAMGIQTGVDGATILNLTPVFLIVPKAKEATARAAMTAVGPSVKAADQNWFAGRLEVVADGVLDATSTVVWYAAADPQLAPGIEYAYLEGAAGPQIVRKENEGGILGIQLYAFVDFGAKALDWRPLYKSSGS